MSALSAIAYVSSAVRPFSAADLDALLLDARAHNTGLGVTGVLLHNDGNFFQYLEGPEDGVGTVYARVCRSRQHHNVIRLLHVPVAQRHFAQWLMAFAEPPKTVLQQLAQARWEQAAQRAEAANAAHPDLPAGVKILLELWSKARRR